MKLIISHGTVVADIARRCGYNDPNLSVCGGCPALASNDRADELIKAPGT